MLDSYPFFDQQRFRILNGVWDRHPFKFPFMVFGYFLMSEFDVALQFGIFFALVVDIAEINVGEIGGKLVLEGNVIIALLMNLRFLLFLVGLDLFGAFHQQYFAVFISPFFSSVKMKQQNRFSRHSLACPTLPNIFHKDTIQSNLKSMIPHELLRSIDSTRFITCARIEDLPEIHPKNYLDECLDIMRKASDSQLTCRNQEIAKQTDLPPTTETIVAQNSFSQEELIEEQIQYFEQQFHNSLKELLNSMKTDI